VHHCPEDTLGRLMLAYQRGDINAFEQLYDAVQHEIRGFFRSGSG